MNETIKDILREMRGCIPQKMEGFENGELVVLDTAKLADRIEAAHRREATCEKYSQVGNAAKMRSAMEDIVHSIEGKCAAAPTQVTPHEYAILHRCKAALSAPPEPIGNVAKMREALLSIRGIVSSYGHKFIRTHILRLCNSALAEPPRNCDIGTAEEQAERFKKFCSDHQEPWHGCSNYCPILMSEKCAITWAQMPYKEGENSEDK